MRKTKRERREKDMVGYDRAEDEKKHLEFLRKFSNPEERAKMKLKSNAPPSASTLNGKYR